MRLVVLVLLVVLAVWLVRRALRAASTKTGAQPRGPVQQGPQQDLISCARCGVHLPRSEAHSAAGELYCGEEHARLGAGPR